MGSLVERLRQWPDRRPVYNIDISDDETDHKLGKSGASSEKFERLVREDAKNDACQSCGESGDLLECETCTYTYHPKCLLPPLKEPFPNEWKCLECVSPLHDIEKILDCQMRPTEADDGDASTLGSKQIFAKQYLVKWKGFSYLHCSWVPEKQFIKAFEILPRLKTKVNNFQRQMSSVSSSGDDYVAIRPEWTTVDRILSCRGDDEKEYLVKWKELPYEECYWEFEADISTFQTEIERFIRIQSKRRRPFRLKNAPQDASESQKELKDFHLFEQSPNFLSGGPLHPFQLEGLNILRFSWSKQLHVILADEMGLGKTIQSIAFLASLFEEGVYPHLVVASLSTLRNWEREFAAWAPQLNVIMYVGSGQARSLIRQNEFYYAKKPIPGKLKKKKFGPTSSERKQERIKFDVLLTSYEMINYDAASLKPIKWECMVVDEGDRLKNKDSKFFIQLKQFNTKHRVLLRGTRLQNNLDELFMLVHFLDARKFGCLEELQEEFKDISKEEQISRLHKILAPHLLRRLKKDVMKELPPKKELILPVELSSKQKEYYKAILTRNYELLTRKSDGQISLINVVMELRKLCCHPYMLDIVEPVVQDSIEIFNRQLLESSGKLQLLDKMMVKLKEQGHRVLIYSQFQHMLDILEDYLTYKQWQYERIDGKVSGAERQLRIDRFNAKNSSRFCLILSTRAGGVGINLPSADTVIIYDSDWNPHADLQAMARAHRLGQTNKVMIYRLVTRGSIEERMMELTKKKMILEHLVVGKLKTQNINQEELDDIIRYGSKDLFADETEEAKPYQIHYDDIAIDRLLDRERADKEEITLDEVDDNGFLKALKVANFEFVDEAAAAEAQKASSEAKSNVSSSERTAYWEDLLRRKYEVHKVEETNSLRNGKRSHKQMMSVDDDDLAGFEYVSSDEEDYNNESDVTDSEMSSSGELSGRRTNRKRARAEIKAPPLMEGEGKSFRVLGFNRSQRAAFVQILMRFGTGEYDWADFVPRMKKKTPEEVVKYGQLMLSHLAEGINYSPTFSDGVPKEGLMVTVVLYRIGILTMIRDKVKSALANPEEPLFGDDVTLLYPLLSGGKVWKPEHDLLLLLGVRKHGYGRWQDIYDDQELKIQEVIYQEMDLPLIKLASIENSQPQGVTSMAVEEPSGDSQKETVSQNCPVVGVEARDMQRRLVDFVRKRVYLLEKALSAEYQKEYYGDGRHDDDDFAEQYENAIGEQGVDAIPDTSDVVLDNRPRLEPITPKEMYYNAYDTDPRRQLISQNFNQMCNIIPEAEKDFEGDASIPSLKNKLDQMSGLCTHIYELFGSSSKSRDQSSDQPSSSTPVPKPDNDEQVDDRNKHPEMN